MFNVCFVCHPWSRTVQYEPALIKLSNFLKDLELDSEFLYNEFNNEALQDILEKVFRDLNAKGECSVRALNYTLELKVISIAPDPPQVIVMQFHEICVQNAFFYNNFFCEFAYL